MDSDMLGQWTAPQPTDDELVKVMAVAMRRSAETGMVDWKREATSALAAYRLAFKKWQDAEDDKWRRSNSAICSAQDAALRSASADDGK